MGEYAVKHRKKGSPANSGYFRDQLTIQWVILALGILATGIWLGHALKEEYVRVYEDRREQLADQTRMIDRNLRHQFGALKRTLAMIGGKYVDTVHSPGTASLNGYLTDLTVAMPGLRFIFVQDARGRVVQSSSPELMGLDFSEREYFKRPVAGRSKSRIYLSPPFHSLHDDFVMPMSARIEDREGNFRGVAVAALDSDFFRTLLSSALHSPDIWAAMAHGGGTVFIMTPDRPGIEGINLAVEGSFFSLHRQGGRAESIWEGRAYLTGEERLIALRTVAADSSSEISGDSVVIGVTQDLKSIHSGWYQDMRTEALLFALLAITLSWGLLHHQRRQLASREQGLAHARKLRELSEEYDRFFALSPDLFCIVDGEGRFVRTNGAWTEALGYTQEELSGMRYIGLVHPEDLARSLEVEKEMRSGAPTVDFVNRLVTKTGGWRFIEWHSTAYRDGKAYAVARDVTERVAAEAERERLLHELTDALSEVKTLSGLLPICSACKKVRDDKGYWKQIEMYISERSNAQFTHGICPECLKTLYPDFARDSS